MNKKLAAVGEFSFHGAIAKVELGGKYDGDQDGVAAAEAGMYVKFNSVEFTKELLAKSDSATIKLLLPIMQEFLKTIDLQKEIFATGVEEVQAVPEVKDVTPV